MSEGLSGYPVIVVIGGDRPHLDNQGPIFALADRVRRLRPPGHRDPERFWREKSEIAHALETLASDGRAR